MLRTLAALTLCAAAALPARAEGILAHDVYFKLNDGSPEARAKLVAACMKYLTGHEGTVYFSAGTLAAELPPSLRGDLLELL